MSASVNNEQALRGKFRSARAWLGTRRVAIATGLVAMVIALVVLLGPGVEPSAEPAPVSPLDERGTEVAPREMPPRPASRASSAMVKREEPPTGLASQVEIEVVSALDAGPVADAIGVLVMSSAQGETGRLHAVSDHDGILRFAAAPLQAARVEVEVGAEGYVSAVKPLRWLDQTDRPWRARVALTPGERIEGLVVDERNLPIAGARIQPFVGPLQPEEFHANTGQADYRALAARSGHLPATVTDAEGRFAVQIGPKIPLSVHVAHSPYRPTTVEFTLAQMKPGPVVVVLRPGHTLVGRTVDSKGKPVARASVSLQPQGGEVAYSGPDGRFEIRGVAASEGAPVYAWTQAARSAAVFMVPGWPRDVVLEHTLEISGRVISSAGAPVAEARVIYSPTLSPDEPQWANLDEATLMPKGELRTNRRGEFTVGGLAPGQYSLVALNLRGTDGRQGGLPGATAVAEAGSRNVQLELSEASYISGRLIYPDGAPALGNSLEVLGHGTNEALSMEADGRFLHGPIYVLAKSSYRLRFRGPAIQDHDVPAELEPSLSADLGDIIVQPGRQLTGTIHDTASGVPVVSGLVRAWDANGQLVAQGTTDELGVYQMAVPPNHPLRVQASYRAVGASRVKSVGPTTERADFQLPEFGEVVVTSPQAAAANADVMLVSSNDSPGDLFNLPETWNLQPERGGSAVFRQEVPPGDYYVYSAARQAQSNSWESERVAVTISAGSVARVTLGSR
jgi:hypothetical protein